MEPEHVARDTRGEAAGAAAAGYGRLSTDSDEAPVAPPSACGRCCLRLPEASSLFPAARRLSWAAVAALLLSSVAQYYSTSVLSLAMYLSLDFTPQQSTLYWMYMSWLYWCSPVVGWLSDVAVVCGQRRRPTMLLGVVVSCVAWTGLWIGTMHNISYPYFVAVSAAATVAQMLVTIPLNGIVVETATAATEEMSKKAAAEQSHGGEGIGDDDALLPQSAAAGDSDEDDDGSLGSTDVLAEAGHEVVGQVQAAAMLWKTVGSLVGSVIQTVVQIYVPADRALAGAPVLFLLLVPAVFLLQYEPRTAAQRRYAKVSLLGRFRELAKALKRTCRRVGRAVRQQRAAASDSSATSSSSRGQPTCVSKVRRITRHPLVALGLVLSFVVVYNGTPDASVMYAQYLADNFWFKEWFLSVNQGVGLLGSVVGCEIYSRFIARRNQLRVFAVGCIASALCYVTRVMLATGFATETMRIPVKVFVPVDSFIVATLTRIAFMPVLHVASERSPPGFEAFIFELFSVAAIGGSTIGTIITTKVSEDLGVANGAWGSFWKLLVLCAAAKVIPLCSSWFLPPPQPAQAQTLGSVGGSEADSDAEGSSSSADDIDESVAIVQP